MNPEEILELETAALERLTEDRRLSGSLGPEVEEMLAVAGVFWDAEEDKYTSVDAYVSDLNYNIVAASISDEHYA